MKDLEKKVYGAINNEFKSFILGYLLDEDYKSSWSIKKEADAFGIDGLPKDSKSYHFHCDSNEPSASLSYFLDETTKGTKKWKLNDIAEECAIGDIARFSLYFPMKFNFSLYSLFGSGPNNVPYNSVKTLEFIRNKKTLQKKDLEEELGIGVGVAYDRLNKFNDLNLINFNSIDMNKKGQIFYELSKYKKNGNNSIFKRQDVSEKILNHFDKNKDNYNYIDLSNILNLDKKQVQSELRLLERKGYLKCNQPWVGSEKYSEIKITNRGVKLYDDFVKPISKFLKTKDKNSLKYIKRKQIYPNNLPLALETYFNIAPSKIKQSKMSRKEQVLDILELGQGTHKEIKDQVGVSVMRYIKELIDEKKIKKISRGKYSIKK